MYRILLPCFNDNNIGILETDQHFVVPLFWDHDWSHKFRTRVSIDQRVSQCVAKCHIVSQQSSTETTICAMCCRTQFFQHMDTMRHFATFDGRARV